MNTNTALRQCKALAGNIASTEKQMCAVVVHEAEKPPAFNFVQHLEDRN